MSAEKVIVAAVETMLTEIREVLERQGIQVQAGQAFDLKEHGLYDKHGKLQHSDSQRILTDPEAMKAYQERSGKALWNFAVTLQKILAVDGLMGKGKLGLSQTDFLGANIDYLDAQHRDENGLALPGRGPSFALLIVDPNTLALGKIYRQFLTTVVENKEGIFKMLPWVVAKLIGSVLQGAVDAAGTIKDTLNYREREYDKMTMTLMQPANLILNTHRPFFMLLDKVEEEIGNVINTKENTPEQNLMLIDSLKQQLANTVIEKESIVIDVGNLERASLQLSWRSPREVEVDIQPLLSEYDKAIETLKAYEDRYDDALVKKQTLLQQLDEIAENIKSKLKDGKRTTPMEDRPGALTAQLEALRKKDETYRDAQLQYRDIQLKIDVIKSSLPLSKFLEKSENIKFPYPQKEFAILMKTLGLTGNEVKKYMIISDSFVVLQDSKDRRQKVYEELVGLVRSKLGNGPDQNESSVKKLREKARDLNMDTDLVEKNRDEMVVLSRRVIEAIQKEIKEYQNKMAPLVSALEAELADLRQPLNDNNIELARPYLNVAEERLLAIDQLSREYADCEPDLSAPEVHERISDLRSDLDQQRQKIMLHDDDLKNLNQRKVLYTDYFSDKGLAIQYLDKRAKTYKTFDKLQMKFSFFRPHNGKSDSADRRDFIYELGLNIINYVDSGEKQHLQHALDKINNALESNKFPSRKSRRSEGDSMKSLLMTLKKILKKLYQQV